MSEQEHKIKILKINWHEFSHSDLPKDDSIEFDYNNCDFLVNATFEFGELSDEIIVFISTKITYSKEINNESVELQLVSSLYSFGFNVYNLSEFLKVEDERIVGIQVDLAKELLNISYATNRGVISARTEGTVLSSLPLPIIDPIKLL